VGVEGRRIMIGRGAVSVPHFPGSRWLLAMLLALLAVSGETGRGQDPPTAAAVKVLLDGVREDLDADRPQAARDRYVTAVDALTALVGGEPPAAARGLLDRARGLRDDLELQGVDVDGIELPSLPRAAAKPKGDSTAKSARGPAGTVRKRGV